LKYGFAGRAIITIAIATPASNDKTSIILTHLRVPAIPADFQQRAIQVDCPSVRRSALANRSCVDPATRASY
jgi:hypothetical protein